MCTEKPQDLWMCRTLESRMLPSNSVGRGSPELRWRGGGIGL